MNVFKTYLFLHKRVVCRHFHIFNMASKMAANGHLTIFIIIASNTSLIYKQHSIKVSQQYVEWFWRYPVLKPYTLNIQESLKHAWH